MPGDTHKRYPPELTPPPPPLDGYRSINPLAETINGLHKTELIKRRGPWHTVDHVEYATADYINCFNHRRLYDYCGDIPPVELEMAYYAHHVIITACHRWPRSPARQGRKPARST